jgi:hypothetical protein
LNVLDDYSNLQYATVITGIMLFYTVGMLTLYAFRRCCGLFKARLWILVELVIDGLLCVLLLAAASASAATLNKAPFSDAGEEGSILPETQKYQLQASVGFAFLSLILLLPSTFISLAYFKGHLEASKSGYALP